MSKATLSFLKNKTQKDRKMGEKPPPKAFSLTEALEAACRKFDIQSHYALVRLAPTFDQGTNRGEVRSQGKSWRLFSEAFERHGVRRSKTHSSPLYKTVIHFREI